MALLVYVDDLVLTRNDLDTCSAFKPYLNSCSCIEDVGPLKYFLGTEAACSPQGLFMSQCKYALEIVEECWLLGAKPTNFLMETNHKLCLATRRFLDDATQYRRIVGRVLYPTISRPKLSYFVHILSQFMQNPRDEHMAASGRVLHYLKGVLLKGDSNLQVVAYNDSDWGACPLK